MKVFEKKWSTTIPAPMQLVWPFFADPVNLQRITPKDMNFRILTDLKEAEMYQGLIIRYKVTPLAGIPLNWVTEITAVQKDEYFIDEQRFGPFSFWHHEHRFTTVPGGVRMTDLLHYALPLGIIGRLTNRLVVAKRIDHIFEFRQQVIDEMFASQKVYSDQI
ncbi:MAG: SRPBCC family protein [Saprospiraceae bacterium]|nr:SRPBCC family protein [Saprospiraceae bacterium]